MNCMSLQNYVYGLFYALLTCCQRVKKKKIRGDYDASSDFEKDLNKGADFVYFLQGRGIFFLPGCHRVA
jgi:hypothetical protein